MLMKKPQAISGVSADYENIIEELFPSIAATTIGQFLGRLYNCIPLGIGAVNLSQLLFALPSAPLAVTIYFLQKLFGTKYVVTNRNVKKVSIMGGNQIASVPLENVAEVYIDPDSEISFFTAADLVLTNAAGEHILRLEGVPYPGRFRQVIIEARDARNQVAASLKTIRARQTA